MDSRELLRGCKAGTLGRRDFGRLLAAAGISLAAMPLARTAGAAGKLLVYDWAGYEDPIFYPEFEAKHGAPDFTFFAGEEEALQKLRAGFEADLTHPCTASVNRWREAGMIKPIDTSRVERWPLIIPELFKFKGVMAEGHTWMMPWDWGYSAIAYRPDLLPATDPTYALMIDPSTTGKVAMNTQFDVALAVAGEIAGFKDLFNPTDEEAAKLPDLWKKLVKQSRFLWSDATEVENAMANGEVNIAYLWGGSIKNLRDQGIELKLVAPVLTWACGYVLNTNSTGDEALAYELLNALLDPQAGKELIGWGYGHANPESFKLTDPALLAALGLDDIGSLFAQGKVFDEVAPDKRDQLIQAWEEAQAGL